MPKAKELAELRKKIDRVDSRIVALLAERFKLVKKISKAKQKLGIPTIDRPREAQVLSRVAVMAEKKKLESKYAVNVFKAIISSCKKFEKDLTKDNRKIQR
ncbi:chorismate mutase [Candidatus Hecatella orcuttiae]|jgi:chorismate mutase|uniref:chorismate mutase n=1 Tax=Candidatus Hecatella orcuttiae TaxID=1935119 RepID=UPI002868263C|nr:chorismate mutase [Candidatus Hecatella orcuttiae]